MTLDLTVRFDYGATIPWVRHLDGELRMIAGPSALRLATDVETHGDRVVLAVPPGRAMARGGRLARLAA